jgi:hypothetical protein
LLYLSFLSLADALPAAPLVESLVSSLVDVLPAAPLAALLVSFSSRRLARRAARCIACFFLLPTSCPPRRSLHCLFRSLLDVLPAAPLAALRVSFSCRPLAPPRRSLHRSFLSLVDVLPAAPLAESLVSFSCRRHARRAARSVARFFLLSTSCPPRRSLNRSFLSLVDATPAAPLAASLVSVSCRRVARCAAR